MTGKAFLRCCIALAIGTSAVFAIAQPASNPFGQQPLNQNVPAQPRANDPFGPAPSASSSAPSPSPQVRPEAAPQRASAAAVNTPTDESSLCKCLGESGEAAIRIAAIKKALAGPLRSTGLEFNAIALEQVVADISADYGVPIQLDRTALEDAGLGPDEPVTINLHGVTLKSALIHLLRQHALTYIIRDEVLVITTRAVADDQVNVCLYDIRDLVGNGQDSADVDSLIDVLTSCIQPDTWTDGGGSGNIRPLQPGLLAVSQSQQIHEQVHELLTNIRQMRRQPAAAAMLPNAPKQVVTRYYMLQAPTREDQDAFQNQLRELIGTLVPNQTWTGTLPDGQSVVLAVWPDRVVVRHHESVQRQVRMALADIGLVQRGAGFGGGGWDVPRQGGGFGGGGYGGGGGGGGFFQPQAGGN